MMAMDWQYAHRVRGERERWWEAKGQWPKDTRDHLFLARALHSLGATMYPTTWTGHDPCSPNLRHIDLVTLEPDEYVAMHNLFVMRTSGSGRFLIKEAKDFALEPLEWIEVRRWHNELVQYYRPARERWASVQERIAEGLRLGEVQSFTRPPEGALELRPLDPNDWNTESLLGQRFFSCQMNPDDPFAPMDASRTYPYIYVSLRGFMDWVGNQKPSQIVAVTSIPGPARRVPRGPQRKGILTPQQRALEGYFASLPGGKDTGASTAEVAAGVADWLKKHGESQSPPLRIHSIDRSTVGRRRRNM